MITATPELESAGAAGDREALGGPGSARVLIDAHVHLHGLRDLEALLDGAADNFRANAIRHTLPPASPGFLLLAQPPGDRAWGELQRTHAAGRWTIAPTEEPESLIARCDGDRVLVLIAGWQLATTEGLEVLALATTDHVQDVLPTAEAIRWARARGAVPVLPWGVGKWTARRGALVERLIAHAEPGTLYVGDNAGRLRRTPLPTMICRAMRRGIWALPGSDPLPFVGQHRRVGRYGFILPGPVPLDRPALWLCRQLEGLEGQPPVFGELERLSRFVLLQTVMQIRKLARRVTAWGRRPTQGTSA